MFAGAGLSLLEFELEVMRCIIAKTIHYRIDRVVDDSSILLLSIVAQSKLRWLLRVKKTKSLRLYHSSSR